MSLEVQVGELGERQLGLLDGLAVELRLDDVAVVLQGGALGREHAAGLAVAVVVVVAELVLA